MNLIRRAARHVALWVPAIRRVVEERNRLKEENQLLREQKEPPVTARKFFRVHSGRPVEWAADFDVDEGPFDVQLMGRIASACRSGAGRSQPTGMWAEFTRHHSDIVSLLTEGRFDAASQYLKLQYGSRLTHGFQQGHNTYRHLAREASARAHICRVHADRLLRLAETFGVIPIENPEQGEAGRGFDMDPDELLRRIEVEFGARLDAPRWQGGLFGLRTSRGIFTERHFAAVCLAKRISEICPDRESRICEIGAGAGYVAYYCHKLGYHDFTIVDLPSVNISQAYLLMRAMSGASFRLQGEPEPLEPGRSIRILADHALENAPSGCFDMVLNADSLPEMSTETATGVCKTIARVARRFLSVNHETKLPRIGASDLQERVPEILLRVGGFQRMSRAPFWMREGHVEELYAVDGVREGLSESSDDM